MVENIYRLQIMNAAEQTQHYTITASGLPGLVVLADSPIEVGPAQARWVLLRLHVPYDAVAPGSHPVQLQIETSDHAHTLSEKAAFIMPR
jgi:polyferredoxin